MKDPIPDRERKDVVYLVNCLDCADRCYIGTTRVYIGTRMDQHKKTVEKKDGHKSALAGHAIDNRHNFDLDNPLILERHNQRWKREFLEELHIYSNKKCVNIKSKESRNVILML